MNHVSDVFDTSYAANMFLKGSANVRQAQGKHTAYKETPKVREHLVAAKPAFL